MTDALGKIASTTAAAAKAATPEADKLKEAAKQFEAVFLRQIIKSMRSASGSDGDGLFDSSSTQQFRDMSDAKLADQMAAKGTLHIADMLVKQYGARLSGAAKTATAGAATAATSIAGSAATTAAQLGLRK